MPSHASVSTAALMLHQAPEGSLQVDVYAVLTASDPALLAGATKTARDVDRSQNNQLSKSAGNVTSRNIENRLY
jgi:hypothetical protein